MFYAAFPKHEPLSEKFIHVKTTHLFMSLKSEQAVRIILTLVKALKAHIPEPSNIINESRPKPENSDTKLRTILWHKS